MSRRAEHSGGGGLPDRRVTNELLAFMDGIQSSGGAEHIVVIGGEHLPVVPLARALECSAL